mmetsp:Transcript_111177/g.295451  ORF Transcript_111177/g.295451 Transcript_111177/m.295451 type:complete len:336 (+) Transcript_111177:1188-2195(+)
MLRWDVHRRVPPTRRLAALLAREHLPACAGLPQGGEAVGHLRGRASQGVVVGVRAVPAHGVRPGRLTAGVLDDLGVVRQLASQASPVADGKEVAQLGPPDLHCRPGHAVVLEWGRRRGHTLRCPCQNCVRIIWTRLHAARNRAPTSAILEEPVLPLLHCGVLREIAIRSRRLLPDAMAPGPHNVLVALRVAFNGSVAIGVFAINVLRDRCWSRGCHHATRNLARTEAVLPEPELPLAERVLVRELAVRARRLLPNATVLCPMDVPIALRLALDRRLAVWVLAGNVRRGRCWRRRRGSWWGLAKRHVVGAAVAKPDAMKVALATVVLRIPGAASIE